MTETTSPGEGTAARHRRTPHGYFALATTLLQTDTVTDFDIYIWPAEEKMPVLYRQKDLRFEEEVKRSLKRMGSPQLYAKLDEATKVSRYVEQHLGQIIAADTIPQKDKAQAVYDSALQMVKDLLREPEAPQILKRSELLVANVIQYITGGKQAFHQLLALTSFDYTVYTHSANVGTISTALASELGYTGAELQEIGVGALFHDIGKTKIDQNVLDKMGALTDEEWNVMKKHPEFGLEIVSRHRAFPESGMNIILEHHEKLNGKGYPYGKTDAEIHPYAKLVAVADIFDALTTERCYRKAFPTFPALEIMKKDAGEQIDRDYFERFVRLLGK